MGSCGPTIVLVLNSSARWCLKAALPGVAGEALRARRFCSLWGLAFLDMAAPLAL